MIPGTRADGIVFVIQGTTNTAGGTGQDLGFTGINPGFGIEFDTYKNAGSGGYGDPDNNHVAIITNGSADHTKAGNPTPVSVNPSIIDLADGTLHYCWIDYDGTTVTVRLSNTNNRSTSHSVLSQNFNIAALFGGNTDIYYGFTASTGGSYEEQDVNSYYFNNNNSPGGIDTSLNTYTSGPYIITTTVSPAYVATNGTSHISALVKDLSGNPMSGETITFSSTSGTFSAPTAVTNASGYAYDDLTGSGAPAAATVRASAACGTYGVATVNFENPTKVQIETAANGSGTVVAAQSLSSGTPLTVYAIARDASDNYLGNDAATWSFSSKTGGVVNGDLVASGDTKSAVMTGHLVGTGVIHAVDGALSGNSGTVTVISSALDHFGISAISSPQTAGTAITGITLTAQDVNNNTVTGFATTVAYSGTAGITGTSAAFTSGVLTGVTVTPITAGATMTFIVTGSAKTGTSTFTVNPGALDHFGISAVTSPQVAGTPITGITLTAQDLNNNTVTGFATTVAYSGTAGITGTSAAFTSGVLTGVTVTPTTAGATMTFIVTGSAKTGTSTFAVNAGALDHFGISAITSPQTAGTAIPGITLTAQDVNNNTVTGFVTTVAYSGTAGITGTSAAFTSGVLTGVSVTPTTAGASMTFIVTGSAKTGTSTFTVKAASANKLVMKTEPSATATAGVAFATQPAVYVEDTFGNVVTTDTSTIAAVLATGSGPLQGTASISAVAGVATFTNLADNKAESITLKFSDGALTGVIDTTTIVISAAALDHFTINTPSGPTNYGTFPITVTAQDTYGNTVTTYNGTNTLTDSTGSILPASTGSFVSGTWTGNITIASAPNGDIISTTGGGKSGASSILPATAPATTTTPIPAITITVTPTTKTTTATTTTSTPITTSTSATTSTATTTSEAIITSTITPTPTPTPEPSATTSTNSTSSLPVIPLAAGSIGILILAGISFYLLFIFKLQKALAFITEVQKVKVGQVSGAIRIQVRNRLGNAYNVPKDVILHLSSDSPTGKFDISPSGGFANQLNEIIVPKGQNSVNLYYKDISAGVHTLMIKKQTGLHWKIDKQKINIYQ